MSRSSFVVAGTDTDIGKTVFSAALTGALDGAYFKPVQSGLDGVTDTDAVRKLTGLPDERFLPEVYRLAQPLSPHRSAELDGVEIDPARLTPRPSSRPLVVELAGGLMVPLNRKTLFIDVIGRWNVPVILCARTALGTINHTLLSIDALRHRSIPLLGTAFIGDENADTERTITEMGNVRRLGRLPRLNPLDRDTLARAFAANFNLQDFR
jgi:dethiobiotin synthetase